MAIRGRPLADLLRDVRTPFSLVAVVEDCPQRPWQIEGATSRRRLELRDSVNQ